MRKMLQSEIKSILNNPTWILFISATIFYVLGLFLFSHFVWSADFYEVTYTGKTNFEDFIDITRRIDVVRYLLSPVYIFSITMIISMLIKFGLAVNNININNKLLFKIVLIAIFILFLSLWVKTVWFVLIKGSYTMEEVKFFYPLSVLNFFDHLELQETIKKALGKINIYHLVFMIFVAWSIKIYSGSSFLRLFGIVFYTYGISFLILKTIPILFFI